MRQTTRFFVTSLAMLAAAAAWSQITINSSVKDGQTISGYQNFRFTVSSKHLITEVEFYVGEDLRETDESTPYEFSVDTIAEKEGPINVKVLAYDTEGNRAELKLGLKVDNEIEKGADYHIQLGQEAIATAKWDDAIMRGRIALKVKPKYIPARMLLARANFGKRVYDAAQKFTEEVLAEDPNNAEALDLRSAVALQTAFGATAESRQATVAAIGRALKQAAESRSRIYANRLEAFGKVTDENRMAYTALAVRAGRFSLVLSELEPLFRQNPRNSAVANRLIYTQIRAGRFRNATDTAGIYANRGLPDAAGWALIAIVRQRNGDQDGSITAESEAIKNDSSDLTVRSAQAYLALMRGRRPVFGQLITGLAQEEDQRFEVMHYQSLLANMGGDFELARTLFQNTVLSEPTAYDTYVQRANQLIGFSTSETSSMDDVKYYRDLAKTLFDAALAAKPESFEALTGLSILAQINGQTADSLRFAQAAVAAGPEYAPAHFQLALVQNLEASRLRQAATTAESQAASLRANGQVQEANTVAGNARKLASDAERMQAAAEGSARTAGQLDKPNLEGTAIPNILESWRYFATWGRPVLLIAP